MCFFIITVFVSWMCRKYVCARGNGSCQWNGCARMQFWNCGTNENSCTCRWNEFPSINLFEVTINSETADRSSHYYLLILYRNHCLKNNSIKRYFRTHDLNDFSVLFVRHATRKGPHNVSRDFSIDPNIWKRIILFHAAAM